MMHVQDMLNAVKEHNEDLERLTAQLAKATDAKTVFVRETSHEIRTPAQRTDLRYQPAAAATESGIRTVLSPLSVSWPIILYAASYNTRDIINNVLEFSRIEAGKLDTPANGRINVREWLDIIVNMHQYGSQCKSR